VWQWDSARPVIQIVNVDDLWLRVLNVRYGEANSLHRLRRAGEAEHRDGFVRVRLVQSHSNAGWETTSPIERKTRAFAVMLSFVILCRGPDSLF
jgi:hypothetical protein